MAGLALILRLRISKEYGQMPCAASIAWITTLSIAAKSTMGFFMTHTLHRSRSVLGNAVAEGPVFLLHLDKVDENVLTSEANALVHPVGDCFVEGFFGLDRPSLVEGELDDQRVRASIDSEIGRIDEQGVPGVLGNHLKAIIPGYIECRDHRIINGIGDGAAVFRRLAGW